MNRYVCVHGHFYQPPRENPWLEAIEQQESAYPYHDWNERITEECYLPNARSRILDDEDWITKIVNNYARMSFNFGPTLLSWMAVHSEDAYKAILEADRLSLEHFDGHGSAMAQAYNHLIMPLANDRDRRTQVLWGIRDFEHRFGRKPEGMWLPETGVDLPTLEDLAAQGIRFTVLAPRQAKRFRAIGEEAWTDLDEDGIDPSRVYLQKLPSGREIALFFYDGPVSQAVAFERLLNSGVTFSDRILSAFGEDRDWEQLAHIATDGETYGHHHRHGDMALSFALERIENENLATLTNYGAYLASHPPEYEVDVAENTSWSCYHGVERWRADCGCHSGMHPDWNQAWRAPLRAALDWLRDELAPVYEKKAGELLKDPWAARDAYIDVIVDRSDEGLERFFSRHGKRGLTDAQQSRALQLLELQRHAMLMYTSCGWFFDDLSGIETVQVIQYAGRVIQLARDACGADMEEGFLERLDEARSNLPRMGGGRRIYERFVKPAFVDLADVAAHSAISSLFENGQSEEHAVYCYRARESLDRDLRAGQARLRVGHVELESTITRRTGAFDFAVVHLGDHVVSGGVRPADQGAAIENFTREAEEVFKAADFVELFKLIESHFGSATYSLGSLFRDQQRAIVERVLESTLDSVRATYRAIHERNAPLLRYHAGLAIPAPRELLIAAELVINEEIRQVLAKAPEALGRIPELLEEAEHDEITLDELTLSFSAETAINRLAGRWLEDPDSLERLSALNETVQAVDRLPFEVDREAVQNVFYELMHAARPGRAKRAASDDDAAAWIEQFDELGGRLQVRIQS